MRFLEKISTQTTVCVVVPTPGGKSGALGASRGQTRGEVQTAQHRVQPPLSRRVQYLVFGLVCWGGCVVFFCLSDEGCSAR